MYGCKNDESPNTTPTPDPKPPINDWTFQQSNAFVNFTDIFFISSEVGWVVGENNTILSTTSGGKQWPEAPVNSFEGNFRSVHLIDENIGWITGDKNEAPKDGYVYVSSNGGAYPEPQKIIDFPLNTVFNLDKEHGWTGGENGQMLYTTDGGFNWNESTSSLDFTIFDVHFLDKDKGWATGTKGKIIRSADGGVTWQNEYDDPDIDLFSIHLIDSLHGWACGTDNTILIWEEENGIKRWLLQRVLTEPSSMVWHDIFFIDDQIGWIVGNSGTVYKSVDGGKKWIKESTGVFSHLNAVHMVNAQKGWIAGDEGVILTYTPL